MDTHKNLFDEAIKESINFDAIAEVERNLGKSIDVDVNARALALLLFIRNNKDKDALFEVTGDTSFCSEMEQNICVALNLGFTLIYNQNFVGTNGMPETYKIFWNNGILLCLESHETIYRNSSDVYFAFEPKNQTSPFSCNSLHHCSGGFRIYNGKNVFVGSKDTREGLKYSINSMKKEGKFLTKWPDASYVRLLNYMEWKECDKWYKENENLSFEDKLKWPLNKTIEKIHCLPKDIQRCLGEIK